MSGAGINVADVIDRNKLSAFQIGLFVLCGACLIMDGFDVQAVGYVGPAIIQDWKIPPADLGNVFGAANFGILVGSVLFTMLADKIGRRPVLIAATLFFAFTTIATVFVNSVNQLLLIRFISGLGLGCIMPNATALVGEYSPRRNRVTLMMTFTVGFNVGAALGGFLAAWLIPAFGWRSVFLFGGATPLLIAVLMFIWMPESAQFLVLSGKSSAAVGKWLRRIDPSLPANATFTVDEESRKGVPVIHLFGSGRALGTILYWILNFMNLLNLYFLANWLATVVRELGYPTSTAVLVSTMLQVGGTFGTFGLAWLISRLNFVPVLTVSFVIAAFAIAAIGQGLSLPLLFTVVFIAGWCVLGGQQGINALGGTYYPTYLRSTGVGWGLGIGRAGAIIGPVLGGEFLRLGWSTHDIFMAAAVPALIATAVILSMRWIIKPQHTEGKATETPLLS